MEFDVFISHSSKDKTMADAVCAKLEQAGVRCWIAPRDITPGMTWSGEIMKAIDKCKVMVLVFSSNANESVQIIREVESAVHRSKPILPLRIENIQPSDSMAFFMNSVHWLDAISEPHERYLDQLVQAVSSLLGNATAPGSISPKQVKSAFDWKPICYAVPGVVALVVLLVFFLKPNPKPIVAAAAGSGPIASATRTCRSHCRTRGRHQPGAGKRGSLDQRGCGRFGDDGNLAFKNTPFRLRRHRDPDLCP